MGEGGPFELFVVISVVALGLSRTLVGMGAVAVPACHRQGPMLQPLGGSSTFTSELGFQRGLVL